MPFPGSIVKDRAFTFIPSTIIGHNFYQCGIEPCNNELIIASAPLLSNKVLSKTASLNFQVRKMACLVQAPGATAPAGARRWRLYSEGSLVQHAMGRRGRRAAPRLRSAAAATRPVI